MTNQISGDGKNEKADAADGRTVEVVVRNGVVIETTRDAQGNVIEVVKRIKPLKEDGSSREAGPSANEERRPV